MNDEILEMLNGEIARLRERLATLTPGTDEYERTANELVDLYDRRTRDLAAIAKVEEVKIKDRALVYQEDKDNNDTLLHQQELELKEKELELKEKEMQLKVKELEDQKVREINDARIRHKEINEAKKARVIGYVFDCAKLGVEIGLAVYCMKKGMKFEEEGIFTSRSFTEARNNMFKILFRK